MTRKKRSPGSPFDLGALAPEWQRGFAWVERELGGRIVRAERHARWRPAWDLDLERDGRRFPLHWRGNRDLDAASAAAIGHEARVLQVLEREDIPVPHVYGVCPDPLGIVMERSPGRANLATSDDPEERRAVLAHYVELLARMHAIDVAKFEAIGLERPRSARAVGLGDFARWQKGFRATKVRPEPLIEFGIRWIHDNVPPGRSRVCFLQGDAGQFLFDRRRVTALLDFELAFLGDPAHDLGGLRTRDVSEPLGDLEAAYRQYEELTGEAIDRRALHYHTARFALVTPLATAAVVATPRPGLSFPQHLGWYLVYSRMTIETIAQVEEVELEAPEIPTRTGESSTPLGRVYDVLVAELGGEEGRGETFAVDTALRTALYLREVDRLGPRLESDDLDDVAGLLGQRPANAAEADAELERFVASAPREAHPRLLRYFHRRCLRQEALLATAARELQGVRFQKVR